MSARPLRLKDLLPVLRAITDDDDSATPSKKGPPPSFRVPMKAATPRSRVSSATPLRLRRRPPSAKKAKRSERCLFTPDKEHVPDAPSISKRNDSITEHDTDNHVDSWPRKYRPLRFVLPDQSETQSTPHTMNVHSNVIPKEYANMDNAIDAPLECKRFQKYETPQNEKSYSKRVRTPLFLIKNVPVYGSILEYMDKHMDKKLDSTDGKENNSFVTSCHAVKDRSLLSSTSEIKSSVCNDSNFTMPQKSDESMQHSEMFVERGDSESIPTASVERSGLFGCVLKPDENIIERKHFQETGSESLLSSETKSSMSNDSKSTVLQKSDQSMPLLQSSNDSNFTMPQKSDQSMPLLQSSNDSNFTMPQKSDESMPLLQSSNDSNFMIPQKSDQSIPPLQTSIERIENESIPSMLGCIFKPTEMHHIKNDGNAPQDARQSLVSYKSKVEEPIPNTLKCVKPCNKNEEREPQDVSRSLLNYKREIKESVSSLEQESSTLKNPTSQEKRNEFENCRDRFIESQKSVDAGVPQKRHNENHLSVEKVQTVPTDASSKQYFVNNMALKNMEKNQSTSMSIDSNYQNINANGSMNCSSSNLCQESKSVPPSFKQYRMMNIKGKNLTVLGKLGHGGSSEVFKVMDSETSKMFAVKCVNLAVDPATAKSYVNEIKLLQRLQGSDRVITMYDYEYVKPEKKLYVILEMGDVDLSSLLKYYRSQNKSLPYPIMIGYWTEMLTAVNHIHKNGIIHSDLKPANFLLVHGRLKLIDFGIASSLNGDATSVMKNSTAGTFNYISPEAVTMNGKNSKISYKSDVWSLGCILYSMLYGYTPFHHIKNLYGKIAALSNPDPMINYPPLEGIPPVLLKALQLCLTFDMRKRPTVQELIDLPYINTHNDTTNSPSINENIPISTLVKIKSVLTEDEWLQILKHLNLDQK